MNYAVLLIIVVAGCTSIARTSERIELILNDRLVAKDLSPDEVIADTIVNGGFLGLRHYEEGRTFNYYNEKKSAGAQPRSAKLDSPIAKVEVLTLWNPIGHADRTWRAAAAYTVFPGFDRDMVRVRLTSRTGDTSVKCYYTFGTYGDYLSNCDDVEKHKQFENDGLYLFYEMMEKTTSCEDMDFLDLNIGLYKVSPEVSLGEKEEFEKKLATRFEDKRKEVCGARRSLHQYVETTREAIRCEELPVYLKRISSLYRKIPAGRQRDFDYNHKGHIQATIDDCPREVFEQYEINLARSIKEGVDGFELDYTSEVFVTPAAR